MIEDYDLYRALNSLNPWWSGPWESDFPIKRVAYHEVVKWFTMKGFKRAIVISGARRVGKTVILHQLVEHLSKEGWKSEEVLYLTLDHPILKLAGIDRCLDVYRQNVMPEPKRVALLLDEVQYVKDWAIWIKHAVDFRPELKMVATGSAAIELQTGAEESGVGRWVTVRVPTLSFYEYLLLKEESLPELPFLTGIRTLSEFDESERQAILRSSLKLQDYFHEYLIKGGFPELVKKDSDDAQRLLREDVVDKVLKRDMTVSFGVRHVQELENLFLYLCLHSGGILDKKKVAGEIGISTPTVDKFLTYLEAAHLIFRLNPFERTGKKLLKRRPKFYVADAGLRNAVLLKGKQVLLDPGEMGLCVETAVVKHHVSYYYREHPLFGYWREPRTGREVDLVVRAPEYYLPIEVKYKNITRADTFEGINKFSEIIGPAMAIVVSKNPEDFIQRALPSAPDTKLLIIPAYLLLYLLGLWEKGEMD